jgi:exosortase A-associated hydrolase 1
MKYTEQALAFDCDGCRLIGILTRPGTSAGTGVLIVVGGPQYRAGSHRQFTLLARQLATQGIASMRFDYRGMGDSEGDARNFETIDDDIRAAIDSFLKHAPDVHRVVLWGLCDAASAALYYAHSDARVTGLVLLNPWVHTDAGAAGARLKHYYLKRLTQRAFWTKLLSGKIELRKSAGDLTLSVATLNTPPLRHGGYIDRMLDGLTKFRGNILILLSGNDLVAQEFSALTQQHPSWKTRLSSPGISRETIVQANHTFSSREWRDRVAHCTAAWVAGLAVRETT